MDFHSTIFDVAQDASNVASAHEDYERRLRPVSMIYDVV